MTGDRQQGPDDTRVITSRRRVLAAAALAPVLTAASPGTARALPTGTTGPGHGRLVKPAPTDLDHWAGVAKALGRSGSMLRGTTYHTSFPRRDLLVVSDGVVVTPGLALGTHVAFVRYADGSTMTMGDVVVTEDELQHVIDAWQAHGIEQTALHKHLLAQTPDLWWAHVHGHGHDAVALARGLRAGFDRTGTPPAVTPERSAPVDLDTARMEAALGAKGSVDDGLYKIVFMRRETVTDGHLILPSGLGSTSAFNFQPLGGGRAALSGDCAMLADEVPHVLKALRHGGIKLVELHNHHLSEDPRLFFTHFWAVDDGVRLARALRRAVDATNVVPSG
ncbi:DUF1259 domain-containing protein [Streptomyces sp. NBC_00893]|uniref:DUF1259 domain-containing protein n=1 Tax=Streptomyces sp. NBC_00893 TaxID=2975862 RepID=UPI00224D5EF5|nr:DUF1259 domain-containing protein [Streptomyces sp. NBC_00893]MCX4847126.1 DUF1259 domain-containing protein [Streptomyces sp. NBC_00893]